MRTRRIVKSVRIGYILAGLVFLATTLGFSQAAPDPWLIVTTGRNGPLNLHTTHEDLVRVFGAANVVDQDVDVGEGETQPGTVLFPKDAQRSIEILWRDPDKKAAPSFMTIRGEKSRWKTVRNVSLGTSLKQLEQINGQPFHLTGYDWDYPGTVTSWANGSLAAELDGGHGRVLIRLNSPPQRWRNITTKEQDEVSGDRDFSSNNPVLQKLNPSAYEIIWEFPAWEQK